MENGDQLSVRRLRQGAATGGFLFKWNQSGGEVPTLYKKIGLTSPPHPLNFSPCSIYSVVLHDSKGEVCTAWRASRRGSTEVMMSTDTSTSSLRLFF